MNPRSWIQSYIAIATTFLALNALAFQNEPDGFRGIRWGTPVSTLPDEFQRLDNENTPQKRYARKGDRQSIGNADLDVLIYTFYNDQFFSVFASASGPVNARALRDALESQFGPGSKPNRYLDRWFWHGAVTGISLNCIRAPQCHLLIFSREISRLKREDDKRTGAEKAKGDF